MSIQLANVLPHDVESMSAFAVISSAATVPRQFCGQSPAIHHETIGCYPCDWAYFAVASPDCPLTVIHPKGGSK
jgi:hypothetical protein